MTKRDATDSSNLVDESARLRVELSQLWTRHYPLVHAFICSSINDFHRGEDVLQEVATTAAQKFDDYDPSRPFDAWILGIARNKVLHYMRTQSTDRHVFSDETVSRLTETYLGNAAELPLRRQGLELCLRQLSGRAKKLLERRYVRNEKPAVIAKSSGMTPNAVSILLHRVRVALKACIEQRLREGAGS